MIFAEEYVPSGGGFEEQIEASFADFIAAESEGMIICENCYDNVFDDDEEICRLEDSEGQIHEFCCRECMEEWKNRS